jgi:hypothetical protein
MNIDLTVSDLDAVLFALLYAGNSIDGRRERCDESEREMLSSRLESLNKVYAKIDAIKEAST